MCVLCVSVRESQTLCRCVCCSLYHRCATPYFKCPALFKWLLSAAGPFGLGVAIRRVVVCPYHPELLWLVSLPAVFSVVEDSICSDSEPALALSLTSLPLRVPFLLGTMF